MKWWKRLILSLISLVWGFVSLDYLYYAFGLLTCSRLDANDFDTPQQIMTELGGVALFLVWFLLLAAYTKFLHKISPKIDYLEEDKKKGTTRVRPKLFDVILQYAFILSGLLIRWGYLCLIYFPGKS